ncbi:MAG: hypothetical protein KC435_01305 [Thermomicrobiales bacterium]|nr:hypothetical protein [Thermomicrobiales bacterium]
MSALTYRLHQVCDYADAAHAEPPTIPEDALRRLTEPMLHQFRILPIGDQQHLLFVYKRLVDLGADDDTITAGLIHDVGKACAKCRITMLDRTLHVLLPKIARGPYRQFAQRETAPGWCRGLHRLANHAERGALAAEQAGYNARVITLIRCHEQPGDPADTQMALLHQADNTPGFR